MTDYADPIDQSRELKNISGEYAFEFTKLIKPYSNNEHIEIRENDEILENPTVSDPNSYYRFMSPKQNTKSIYAIHKKCRFLL